MLDTTRLPSATTTPGGSAASGAAQTLDYDAFLRLMIAQMKNQDPTEPMDSAEYMGQLASFSQVEQSVKANAKLDALLTASALSQADGVIGRTVQSADGTTGGEVVSVKITDEGPLASLADGGQVLLQSGVTVA